MPITLLLDLDDTLLDTNIDEFIPAYFSALSNSLADTISPEIMLKALMGGTRSMLHNEDPALTLQNVFDAYFYQEIGREKEELAARIDLFYDEVFPTLQQVTRKRPAAIEFVEWAFSAGCQVAVATNPLFPLNAVKHRLRWAGLSPDDYPFALISSYESFHFTKEVVAYFSEYLAQLGKSDAPVIMVGNDMNMDLLPAMNAGLAVFGIRDDSDLSHPGIPQGSFFDLRKYLEAVNEETLIPQISTPRALLAALRATPAALLTMTECIQDRQWVHEPGQDEWSITEIACHLRDVEAEINLPRLEKMISDDNPFIPGVDSDPWAKERQYQSQQGAAALTEFTETRKQVIKLLSSCDSIWNRSARHSFFGPTSVLESIGIVASHDRAHIQQIWKAIRAVDGLHD